MEAPLVSVPVGGALAAALVESKRPCKWAESESVEAFRVDDLLDFSSGEITGEAELQVSNRSADSSVTVAEQTVLNTEKDHVPKAEDLCVACDEIAELEWLSTFVEDSFSADEALRPAFTSSFLTLNTPKRPPIARDHSQMPVPAKARSKRSRASVGVWSSRLFSTNSCRSSPPLNSLLPSFYTFGCGVFSTDSEFFPPEEWGDEFLLAAKKPSKILRRKVGGDGCSTPRRCSHCLTQRTPQWRAGPLGAKTLCNACGVRFKSGRLLPEYRPAGSPTFVSHQHSNSHRKVLEMRKLKSAQLPQAVTAPAPAPAPAN